MLPIASVADPAPLLIKSRWFRGRTFSLALAAMCLLLLSIPAQSQLDSATPLQQVRGEVVMLTTELVVVKSADGTSILIPLGKGTTVDTSIKVGDWVEVVAMPDRQIASVKKLPAAPPQ
jgi:hypothetical protein